MRDKSRITATEALILAGIGLILPGINPILPGITPILARITPILARITPILARITPILAGISLIRGTETPILGRIAPIPDRFAPSTPADPRYQTPSIVRSTCYTPTLMPTVLALTLNPPDFLTAQLIVNVLVIIIVIHLVLGLAGYSTYGERKISAYIQDRIGPNRTGFDFGLPFLKPLRGLFGLGQPAADGLKFILKEDYRPPGADKALFNIGPMVAVIPALIGFAVIPWGGTLSLPEVIHIPWINWDIPGGNVTIAGASINIGIVYVLAIGSLSVYGITLAGWASNNKYSFLGALRSSAQMISYEIPMGLSILTVLLMVGSLLPEKIIAYQAHHGWLVLAHPLTAVIFFICILAEANRTPFDNAECEQELVGGYHTEYGAMRWALFFLAEYSHMVSASAFFALLFLGGYHLPLGFIVDDKVNHWLSPESTSIIAVILKFHVFVLKTIALVILMMFVRWTIPRLKYDQVMQVAWQGAIPISLVVVMTTSVLVYLQRTNLVNTLAANAAILLVVLLIMPLFPRATSNKKVRLAGSRFYPVVGEPIATAPTNPMAREDRPVQGTAAV